MRIAVASSGLGHVARGIETWAEDTAAALAEKGVDVALFAGGDISQRRAEHRGRRSEAEVHGRDERAPKPMAECAEPRANLHCLRRAGIAARMLARVTPGPLWRYGLKSPYGWEQFTFWVSLRRRLASGNFDILHVQDPMLAFWCRRARERGRLRTQEVLAHGTEESVEFRSGFPCLQELAPWHLEELRRALGRKAEDNPMWIAMPNFVDTEVFRPCTTRQERSEIRAGIGVPAEGVVIGCAAAIKKHHKRIDHLIREVGRIAPAHTAGGDGLQKAHLFLLIAGAGTPETRELRAQAEATLPGRHRFLVDMPRDKMPDIYRAMDFFVLPSLFEMMPIAVLEALASGVPVLANNHPVLEWMIGDGGMTVDMSADGALAAVIEMGTPGFVGAKGAKARERACAVFSREVVIRNYMDYYRLVMDRVAPRVDECGDLSLRR